MTKANARVDVSAFTNSYDSFIKGNSASATVSKQDPRPKVSNPADNLLVKLGYDYAKNVLEEALPSVNRLNDAQKQTMRGYASERISMYESEAFNAVKTQGIEALVNESAKNDKNLSAMEKLMLSEEFAQATGLAQDDSRAQYLDYLGAKAVQEAVSKRGLAILDDEKRTVFFGEAAKIYAEEVAKKVADAKIYPSALINFSRNAAIRSFLAGNMDKEQYESAMEKVVRAKKVALVGAKEDITDKQLEEQFNEKRRDIVVSYAATGIGKFIDSEDTDTMRQGMNQLRKIV